MSEMGMKFGDEMSGDLDSLTISFSAEAIASLKTTIVISANKNGAAILDVSFCDAEGRRRALRVFTADVVHPDFAKPPLGGNAA